MIKIFGTHLCKDCRELKAELDQRMLPYEFVELTEDIANLKEFIQIRDKSPLFDQMKREGKIGIPCIVLEDGTMTLNPEDL